MREVFQGGRIFNDAIVGIFWPCAVLTAKRFVVKTAPLWHGFSTKPHHYCGFVYNFLTADAVQKFRAGR